MCSERRYLVMRYTFLFLCCMVIASFLMLLACEHPIRRSEAQFVNAESRAAGVVVHGCSTEGWIRNDSGETLRIKQVWIFRGETTEWLLVFKPGQKKQQYISPQHGFHVYNMDGVEIGWIRPTRNGISRQGR